MKSAFLLTVAALAPAVLAAAPESSTPPPFQSGETLRYEVVWPSGLTLGEAEFRAQADTGAGRGGALLRELQLWEAP